MVDELELDDDAVDALLIGSEAEVAKAEGLGLMGPYADDGDPLPDDGSWRRKAEYLVRTAFAEKMSFGGITGGDVYTSCVTMLAVMFDWWDSDDAASYLMATAEEMVERKGHVLMK
jgi:hypothetical protein